MNARLPRPHPSVVFQTVADGAVLLQMEEEIYFGLNSVGARIWQLLAKECSELDELCTSLAKGYPEIDPGVLRTDVVELLEQLEQGKLVVASE